MSILTDEDLVLIRELLETLSARTVAKKFDCTVKEMRDALNERRLYNTKTAQIRRLHEEGKTRSECEVLAQCGRSLVNYALGARTRQLTITAGMIFTNLTVLKEIDPTNTRIKMYLCQCKCGRTHKARHDVLMCGKVKSCGCLKGELRLQSLQLRNENKERRGAPKGRGLKTDYDKVRRCYHLNQNEGYTIHEALAETGLNLSAYYRHLSAALKAVG